MLGCTRGSLLAVLIAAGVAGVPSGERIWADDDYGPGPPAHHSPPHQGATRIPTGIAARNASPAVARLSDLDVATSSDAAIVLAQAEDTSLPAASDTPPPEGGADRSPGGGIGFGWLNKTFISGFQSYLEIGSATDETPNAALLEARTDAGSTLENLPGVTIEKRSPVNNNPILQGRRLGQVPARGSYWFPARQDLDTLLSKIDSSLVGDMIAVKGPYRVAYGPGLAFYEVRLLDAPRYDYGFESHGSTSLDYNTNGQQWHGRQELYGGSADWGYRIGYSHRTGSDYETGDGVQVPASYNSRLPDIALGADLTDNSSIDFRYLRLDQTNVEYPGQFFDIDFLVTDAYEVTYRLNDQRRFDRLTVDTWYNRTRFEGDNLNPNKPQLGFDVGGFTFGRLLANTDVDAMSTGFRLAVSWGDVEDSELTAGVDLRYLKQELNEFSQFVNLPPTPPFNPSIPPFDRPPFNGVTNTPIPESHSSNPGLFVEHVSQLTHRLRVTGGARVDWVSTNAEHFVSGTDFFGPAPFFAPVDDLEQVLLGDFDQHFDLWAAYLTAEYALDPCWTLNVGGGHSERPPTMTELYAASPFIAVMPQFFLTSAVGDPNLSPERLWQFDLGVNGSFRHLRGGIQGFYAWIQDYITFDLLRPPPAAEGGLPYAFVNTDLATLAGFEMNGECDLTSTLTAFGSLGYVEGRDHTRNGTVSTQRAAFQPGTPRSGSLLDEEPLPVLAPLESTLGLRWGPRRADAPWTVELFARIVDNQDRIATTLLERPTPGFTTYNLRSYWQATDQLLLTASVFNLTDKNYQEHFDTHRFRSINVFQPGISFYFGAQYTY